MSPDFIGFLAMTILSNSASAARPPPDECQMSKSKLQVNSKCVNAKQDRSGFPVVWPICHSGFELDLAFEL